MFETRVDGLTIIEKNGVDKTRNEWFNAKIPTFASGLRTWGEACVIKLAKLSLPKPRIRIRRIKETARAIISGLPYMLHKHRMKDLITYVVNRMNTRHCHLRRM